MPMYVFFRGTPDRPLHRHNVFIHVGDRFFDVERLAVRARGVPKHMNVFCLENLFVFWIDMGIVVGMEMMWIRCVDVAQRF